MIRVLAVRRLLPLLLRAGAALVIAASLAGTAPLSRFRVDAQEQQPRVFRGGVDLIQVDTYPMRDGKAIEGLTADDFEVFEDGKLQKIQSVEFVHAEGNTPVADRRDPASQEEGNALAADPRGRAFVIYLDTYHVSLDGSSRTRGPLVGFLGRMLAPADVFAVTTPRLRPRDLVFVRSTKTLELEINKSWIWGVQPAGMQAFSLEPEEQTLAQCYGWLGQDKYLAETVNRRREDLVLGNLEDLVAYLGGVREARKSVVLLTRGWQLFGENETGIRDILKDSYGSLPAIGVSSGGSLSSRPAPGTTRQASCDSEIMRLYRLDDERRFRRLLDSANRNNVAFYPVNPVGLETENIMMNDPGLARQELGLRESSFKTIAENTNGIWGLSNDLSANLRRVSDDVASYYLVSYYSTNANLDDKYRRIEVKVRRPGVNVRARPGYFAASSASNTTSAPGPVRSAPVGNALSALAPLENAADVRVYATVSDTELTFVAELSSMKSDAAAWAQGGEVTVDVADSAGARLEAAAGRIEPGARSVLLRVPRAASSGPWRATVRVKGSAETLEEVAAIQPATGNAVFGPPLVFRAAGPPRAPFTPAAEFQFRRTERVRVEWPISGPVPQPSVRILDRLGQPLPMPLTASERETDGRRVIGVDLSAAPLSPGDYVIELSAGDATAGDRVLVAFRVVR